MHEFGLCESILEAVERRAAGRRVTRVAVRCGVLNRVDAPSMQQAFTLLAEGSVASRAALDLEVVPVQVACEDCGRTSEADDVAVECPTCHGRDVVLTGGDELTLVSLAMAGGGG